MKPFSNNIAEDYLNAMTTLSKNLQINVLIFGPDLDSTNPSAKLRKYIASKCKQQRLSLYAERKDLIKAYLKAVEGIYSDYCDYEKKLAQFVDAIIIIPDSCGSFIELGLLALEEEVHPKTLILFDNSHPSTNENLINLGPRKSYATRHARIEDVDYKDKRAIWSIVDDFLIYRKTIVLSRKRLSVS